MGITPSLFRETFPSSPKFSVNDIPDLSGKVIIVTGANTGIGKETAKALLAHNAKVYIAARDKGKTELAIKDLQKQTGQEALFIHMDLADLKSVKAAAEEFLKKENELHVLFNNAGVMVPPVGDLTAQGYDLQFGVNALGHFYFTKLLLPALISGTKSSPDGKTRVVTTASSAHTFVRNVDFNTFKDTPKRRNRAPLALYGQSKFANIIFANEQARRYGDKGIVCSSVNPGNIRTELTRYVPWWIAPIIYRVTYPAPYGALTQLWAGTSAEGVDFNGKYLVPWACFGTPMGRTRDPEIGKELWKWAEEQVENI